MSRRRKKGLDPNRPRYAHAKTLITCGNCGKTFAVTSALITRREKDGTPLFCNRCMKKLGLKTY